MIDELLQERAALYTSGALTPPEREQFELLLELHDELRAFVAEMAETATKLTLATLPSCGPKPSAALKSEILAAVRTRPQMPPEGFVMSGPDGRVQWINPLFTQMCGYTLDELRGKKLGPILQGEKTDRAAAERMRRAVHEHRSCRETLVNYHKDGSPYWVEIAITPILDEAGRALWLIARERELEAPTAA